mmetsp:Transcript_86438/g.175725  ORF Transcript_86438/g.175725 Transcript_86438/m.175725 type:complete len:107 (+) Transcript_86438:604-924(+)
MSWAAKTKMAAKTRQTTTMITDRNSIRYYSIRFDSIHSRTRRKAGTSNQNGLGLDSVGLDWNESEYMVFEFDRVFSTFSSGQFFQERECRSITSSSKHPGFNQHFC